MSKLAARFGVDEIDVSASGKEAALRVVERLTRERDDLAGQWATAIRLAKANGASLREIAHVANASPQSVANVVNR